MKYEFREDDAVRFKEHVNAKAITKGDELVFAYCPYCNGGKSRERDKFSINLKTGQFECKRASCNAKGNMITLSRDFDFDLGNQFDEYYRPKKQYRTFKRPEKQIEPKDKALEYLQSRGISEDIARKYEITIKDGTDNILVFPFFDEKGNLQTIKYRKTDFDKSKDKNKEWFEANCKPILFGMKQCSEDKDRLIITEGQLDSLSVSEAGIDNAVSVPNGAKGFTWIPYCWDWVTGFEEIVVFGDCENEKITLLDMISKRFPNKVKHVRISDYRGCKDANELLQKHGREAVRNAVKNAIFVPIKKIISLADVKPVNIYDIEKLKTGISEVDKLLYGGIPYGMLCVIAGKRGDGKSTFAGHILTNALEEGKKIFAYSGELPNHLFKAWLDFQIAGPHHLRDINSQIVLSEQTQKLIDNWYSEKAFLYDNSIVEDDEKDDLLDLIEKIIMQHDVKVILIDNLMTAMYIDDVRGYDKYDLQGKFVRKLTKIAMKHDVIILLVAHRRKNAFGNDSNDEISGSADITNLAGVVMSYDRPSMDEIEKGIVNEDQRRLIISKNRLFGKVNLKGFILDYDEKSKRIYGKNDDVYRQFGWDKSDGFFDIDEDVELPFEE